MRKPSRRKCKVCGEYFVPKFHDIRIRWCCPEHGAILAMEERQKEKVKAAAKRIKESKDKERAERRDLKARKVALKTKTQWRSEAQAAFNRYVRLRDAGKPCISCGRLPEQKFGGTMDCGHYRTRGAAAHLAFNLHNTAAQCVYCNPTSHTCSASNPSSPVKPARWKSVGPADRRQHEPYRLPPVSGRKR